MKEIYVSSETLYGKFLHKDIKIGEDIFNIGTEINETFLERTFTVLKDLDLIAHLREILNPLIPPKCSTKSFGILLRK